jgi:hypothetical protein
MWISFCLLKGKEELLLHLGKLLALIDIKTFISISISVDKDSDCETVTSCKPEF